MSTRSIQGPADFAAATSVSRETLARLEIYAELLQRWQRRINLISPETVGSLWHRHFFDSAQLLPLIPDRTLHLADLGSGAGFPGLVLALCHKSLHVDLYEADARKAEFLRTVIRETAAPAEVREGRIEDTPSTRTDVLTARALAPLPALLFLLERFWHPDTTAILPKGRQLQSEIRACSDTWNLAYDLVPSQTDSAATILVIRRLSRVGSLPQTAGHHSGQRAAHHRPGQPKRRRGKDHDGD